MEKAVIEHHIKTLNEFLAARNIEYILTGTAGLFYHGLLPDGVEVHDFDIIIPVNCEKCSGIRNLLTDLENLSGCKYDNEHYEQKVYIFKVGAENVKVNAFLNDVIGGDVYPKYQTIMVGTNGVVPIKVHDALDILKAKFSLRRPKDVDFYLKLINQFTSTFLCSKK